MLDEARFVERLAQEADGAGLELDLIMGQLIRAKPVHACRTGGRLSASTRWSGPAILKPVKRATTVCNVVPLAVSPPEDQKGAERLAMQPPAESGSTGSGEPTPGYRRAHLEYLRYASST